MPSSRPGARVALPRLRATVLVLVAGLLGATPLLPQASRATVGDNDYPHRLRSAAQDALVDPWLFYNRECTSFVAWRLNNDADVPFHNYYLGVHWGDASHWKYAANRVGIPVDDTPKVGSVAWWAAGSPGSSRGHVAWVMGRTSSSITIEEYNYLSAGHYDQRTISTSSSMWPSAFLHIGRRELSNTKAPSIPGTPKVGKPLTARPGAWSLPGATFTYRWLADGVAIRDATNRSFAPRPAQLGKRLQVKVTAQIGSGNPVSATSSRSVAVVPGTYKSTKQPSITGTPQVGTPMTATTGRWAPAGATFSYQWIAGGVPVDGATNRSFAPRAEQLGQRIRVQVTATGRAMEPGVALSAYTDAVVPGDLIPTDEPTITGTPQVDNQLSATRGTWSRRASYSYQWSAAGKPVPGAVAPTFAPTAIQLGKRISVAVTASRPGYTTASARSTVTSAVVPATFARSGPPIISGTAQVDRPLTASDGDWYPVGTPSYQWYVGGTAVPGATKTSFSPRAGDLREPGDRGSDDAPLGIHDHDVDLGRDCRSAAGNVPELQRPEDHRHAAGRGDDDRAPRRLGPDPDADLPVARRRAPVSGATSTTFTPTAVQLGKHITIQVTAQRTGYLTALVESAAAAEVEPGTITSVDRPVISGKPYVGRRSPPRRELDGHALPGGVPVVRRRGPVAGATGRRTSRPPTVLDKELTVRVTASKRRVRHRPHAAQADDAGRAGAGRVPEGPDPHRDARWWDTVLTASPGTFTPSPRLSPSYTWLRSGPADPPRDRSRPTGWCRRTSASGSRCG